MAQPLIISPPPSGLKLDLACGQSPREGFEGVDLNAEAQHHVDLFKFPFPWADASADELHCSHFVEHLPMREVEERDVVIDCQECDGNLDTVREHGCQECGGDWVHFLGQDFLFAFFDECWRVLKKDGVMTVVVPNASSWRAFQDPTHRRFITRDTFWYLNADWRAAQKLDHYRVRCDFAITVTPIVPTELTLLHEAAQARRFNESWNTIYDWHAKLVKK